MAQAFLASPLVRTYVLREVLCIKFDSRGRRMSRKACVDSDLRLPFEFAHSRTYAPILTQLRNSILRQPRGVYIIYYNTETNAPKACAGEMLGRVDEVWDYSHHCLQCEPVDATFQEAA